MPNEDNNDAVKFLGLDVPQRVTGLCNGMQGKTPKAKRAALYYALTGNKRWSAKMAGYASEPNTSMWHQPAMEPDVNLARKRLLEEMKARGVTLERTVGVMSDELDAEKAMVVKGELQMVPDHQARQGMVKMVHKIYDVEPPTRHQHDIRSVSMSAEVKKVLISLTPELGE